MLSVATLVHTATTNVHCTINLRVQAHAHFFDTWRISKSLPSYSPVVISSGSGCSTSNALPCPIPSGGSAWETSAVQSISPSPVHMLSKNDPFVLTLNVFPSEMTRTVKPPSGCYAHFHLPPLTVRSCLRTNRVSPCQVAGWCKDDQWSLIMPVVFSSINWISMERTLNQISCLFEHLQMWQNHPSILWVSFLSYRFWLF